MTFPKQVWDQLKSKTSADLMTALEKDGFLYEARRGAPQSYRHPDGRHVVVHFHPTKTKGRKVIKGIINDAGWSEADLRRLKLIK